MTAFEIDRSGPGIEGAGVAAMASALDATFGVLGQVRPVSVAGGAGRKAESRCPHCGLPEGFDGRLHCGCDGFGRMVARFMAGLKDAKGYRRDYQGAMECDGVFMAWENAVVRRAVDDETVVPGAFEVDIRFPRFLTSFEIEIRLKRIEEVLRPGIVDVDRSNGGDADGTTFHVSVDFLDR